MEFSPWSPLNADGLLAAPEEAAAVQVRRRDGLVRYPAGKSAMVFYFYAQASVRSALERVFADEIDTPGVARRATC